MGKRSTPAFPPARIKRIMLSDEDVGKIKKETPVLVSLCVEIFIDNLVNTGAAIAAAKGAKILSAAHLKKVVVDNIKLDFLHDMVSKIPDIPDTAPSDTTETPPPAKRSRRTMTENATYKETSVAKSTTPKRTSSRTRRKVDSEQPSNEHTNGSVADTSLNTESEANPESIANVEKNASDTTETGNCTVTAPCNTPIFVQLNLGDSSHKSMKNIADEDYDYDE